jgi:hypothetical protein
VAVSITGTIQDSSGTGVDDAVVRLSPAGASEGAAEAVGGIGISKTPVEVTTAGGGAFTITAVDFVRYRLEIPSIGFDRYFVCPDSATSPTVAFNTLGLTPEMQTVVRGEVRVSATANTYFTEVTVAAASIDTVRERFTDLSLERSESVAGPWTTIASFTLLPKTNFYVHQDSTATDDTEYFYRALYTHSVTAATSQYSALLSSDSQDENALLVSVDELRENYLFGLDLTDDDGNPFPDRMLEWYIRAGVDWLHKELDIDMVATTHINETHDHYAVDYARWGYFQLNHYPVIAVDQIFFQYPSMQSQSVINPEWIVLEDGGAHGVIQIVPGQGNIAEVLMIPGALFPMWSGATGRVPGIWHFTYRSGFEPGTAPPDIKHAVAMWASIGVLNIAGDLIVGAGIASKSVTLPGLSQNVNTTCLSGDTEIALADGSFATIKSLVGSGPFEVISVDADGKATIEVARDARPTIEDDVLAVHLSNGRVVRSNETHKFRLLDGEWLAAGELQPGTVLTPCEGVDGPLIEVVRVVPTGSREQLYDLTVDATHCFGLSSGVIVHNSSATNAGFGARIIEYQKEIKQLIPNLRRYYGKTTRMMVV